jgi:hypothetical protein
VLCLLPKALTPGHDLQTLHHNTRCSDGAVTLLMTSLFITLPRQLHRVHSTTAERLAGSLDPTCLVSFPNIPIKLCVRVSPTNSDSLLVNVSLPLQGSMRHLLLSPELFTPIFPQVFCRVQSDITSCALPGSMGQSPRFSAEFYLIFHPFCRAQFDIPLRVLLVRSYIPSGLCRCQSNIPSGSAKLSPISPQVLYHAQLYLRSFGGSVL